MLVTASNKSVFFKYFEGTANLKKNYEGWQPNCPKYFK
jgi:hypothetical protein